MLRPIACGVCLVLTACVAQVRGTRIQEPFTVAPPGTTVALISVEVAPWVKPLSKQDDPSAIVKAALGTEFGKSALTFVDQTGGGARFELGPDIAPLIVNTAPGAGEVGQPWPMTALAVGSPPITWKVVEAPPALRVDAVSGLISWTPASTGVQKVVLEASNSHGATKYEFRVDVHKAGAGKVDAVQPGPPGISARQVFVARPPANGPDAPLWLGVQVVGWSQTTETMQGGATRPVVATDIVYTLWTRDGREVDTRRVQVLGIPAAPFYERTTLVPSRSSWLDLREDSDERSRFASLKNEELPSETANANAAAFAYPYGPHKRWFSAQLDESDPALKPGLELSNKRDFEGAFKAFEAALGANPSLAGAYYNMAAMREAQGRDLEAAELYAKACAMNPREGMYSRQRRAVDDRLKNRVVLDLKAR